MDDKFAKIKATCYNLAYLSSLSLYIFRSGLNSSKMNFPGVEFFTKNVYSNNFPPFEEKVYNLKVKSEDEKEKQPEVMESLFVNMRSYLIFGRVIGIIPVSGVFKLSDLDLGFRMLSAPVIINLCITSIISLSAILALIETARLSKSNALQIAQSVQGTLFLWWGLFGYIFFLTRADAFMNIFKIWGKSTIYHTLPDKTFHRDMVIISVVVFLSALVETTVNHFEFFPQFDQINGYSSDVNASKYPSSLETYYVRGNLHWWKLLGYHPIFAIIAFVAHKFVLAGWNYVDVMVILLARALYSKFKGLCDIAEEKLDAIKDFKEMKSNSLTERLSWVHIVKDHDTLCNILEAFEKFLSPLVFGSYATNIYYVCMQLIDGLTPSKTANSIAHSIFAPWSFLHLIMRIFLLSMTAARINMYAHDIGHILKKCPIDAYDAEVARVDKHVTGGPDIGLSGLGCFIVTKPFILSIVNVIFTVEIVLLQGLSSASGPCTTTTSTS